MAVKPNAPRKAKQMQPEQEEPEEIQEVIMAERELPIFNQSGDYRAFLDSCLETVASDDAISKMLVRDIADETWEIMRLRAMRDNVLQQRFTGYLERRLPALIMRGYRCYEHEYKFTPTDDVAYDELKSLEFQNFEDKKEFLEYVEAGAMTEYEWESESIIKAYRAGELGAKREVQHMLAMDNTSEAEIYSNIVAQNSDDLVHLEVAIARHINRRARLIADLDRHAEFLDRRLQMKLKTLEAEFTLVDRKEAESS